MGGYCLQGAQARIVASFWDGLCSMAERDSLVWIVSDSRGERGLNGWASSGMGLN